MANRRMFSLDVVDLDSFLEMPTDSQLLYFHLGSRADDEGFITPQKVMRAVNIGGDALKVLIAKGFLIPFESGVIVITHWKQNNYIQTDRFKPTVFTEEKEKLVSIQNVYKLDTQVRLGKVRLVTTNDFLPDQKEIRVERDAPERPKREPTNVVASEVVEKWNSFPDWKSTGKSGTPPNQSATKTLLPHAKQTRDVLAAVVRKRTKYTMADFDRAIRAYASEIANRKKDDKGYYLHRFTLYEFLTHKEIFERYVNR